MQYEQLIQPALWALSIGTAVGFGFRAALAARRKRSRAKVRPSLIRAGVAGLVALAVVPAIGVVPPGHRGVVYNASGGVSLKERGEGVTLLIPWVQHMRNMSVRTQKAYSSKVYAQSLDLQEITVVASVNYHVEPDRAAEIYRGVGFDYKDTVIQPALFQRTKAAIGQVRAEDFAVSRGSLATTIDAQLTEQLSPYGIVVEFVNIEDAIFDRDFVAAVKAKIVAEQYAAEQNRLIEAEAAIKQQVIIQAEGRARSVLVEATAQAEANRRLALSLSQELLRWQWLVRWDGMVPSTLVGGADATLLLDGRAAAGGGSYLP